jgi:hypothetical protein
VVVEKFTVRIRKLLASVFWLSCCYASLGVTTVSIVAISPYSFPLIGHTSGSAKLWLPRARSIANAKSHDSTQIPAGDLVWGDMGASAGSRGGAPSS